MRGGPPWTGLRTLVIVVEPTIAPIIFLGVGWSYRGVHRVGRIEALTLTPERYASDCSGAEAPAFSWKSVFKVLKEADILHAELIHEFSSEAPKAKGPQKFLLNNCRARRIFNDLHRRSETHGPVFYHDPDISADEGSEPDPEDEPRKKPSPVVRVPRDLDCYVSGFV